MTFEYSNKEYPHIHFGYGKANGNAEQARQIYMNIPCAKIFVTY